MIGKTGPRRQLQELVAASGARSGLLTLVAQRPGLVDTAPGPAAASRG